MVSALAWWPGWRSIPYVGASFGLLEAERHVSAILLGPYNERICRALAKEVAIRSQRHTLLFLVSVIFGDAGLEQLARLVILGDDDDLGFLLLQSQVSMGAQQHVGDEDARSEQRLYRSLCLCRTSHCS
jgi:hypothetical protein